MNHALKIFLFAVVMVLAACENEAYESGDGGLSAMRADFVEMRTDGNSNITSIETDDGEELWLTQAISTAWAERPDTVYRALMYYNKAADGEGAPKAEPLAVSQVLVPQVTPIGQLVGDMKTDPVALVSAWKSPNGRYVNLELSLKTGAADGGTGSHTIGLVCDDVDENADGTRTIRLRLYHDQGGVPEYYSVGTYVSIAASRLPQQLKPGDEVSVSINTYDGMTTREFGF